ncbi:hypothetical protein ACFH04_09180 [Streptomyces noboritoensis]|uniref:Transposase IS701-like DDE domain-containing protein n=1 Tax=Streptomyces noboritoensis TaxID=67337 RepID=A0ABV6THB9_9ACTN
MAGRAGHATPHRIQKFLGEASWSADGLLAEAQAYAARELGDPSATLVMCRSRGWLPTRTTAPDDGFAHQLLIRRSTEKKQLAGGRVDF